MKAKRGFSLLEITVAILIVGLTVTALVNFLDWSILKYRTLTSSWKERACLSDAKNWLRKQITIENQDNLSLKSLNESVSCPSGFAFNELTLIKQDNETFFIKLGIFEDRNRNNMADKDETTGRLFCFLRRS